jgi:hypothetical protein
MKLNLRNILQTKCVKYSKRKKKQQSKLRKSLIDTQKHSGLHPKEVNLETKIKVNTQVNLIKMTFFLRIMKKD